MRKSLYGSVKLADGSRVPLSPEQCAAILADCEAAKAQRAADMPSVQSAIDAMHRTHTRLLELGWREAEYCPKHGSSFDVIEPRSTGIFRAHYDGDWPKGSWWLEDDGDLWPSRPVLFWLDPAAEQARKVRMAAAAARYAAEAGPSNDTNVVREQVSNGKV